MSLVLGKPVVKPPLVSPTAGAPVAPAASGSPAAGSFPPPGSPLGPVKTSQSLPPLPANMDRRKPVANILIVGESGTGKTRSLKDLDWASGTIAYIDVERKGFDWQERIPEDCFFPVKNYTECIQVMDHVEANPKFTIGVVDSFSFVNASAHEVFKVSHTGYDIYSALTSSVKKFLEKCKSKRVRWIVTAIPEFLTTDSGGNTFGVLIKRAAVIGKECEGTVEQQFSYAVYTKVVPKANSKPDYFFSLYSDGKSQAKIPEGVTDLLQMNNSVAELLRLIEKAESGK
jgi:hypothetical protein